MKTKTKTLLIPFDKDGNQILYANDFFPIGHTWKEAFEFNGTLKIYNIDIKGRPLIRLVSLDDGKTYVMLLDELKNILKSNAVIDGGRITGRWTFCKHGTSYSLRLLEGFKI